MVYNKWPSRRGLSEWECGLLGGMVGHGKASKASYTVNLALKAHANLKLTGPQCTVRGVAVGSIQLQPHPALKPPLPYCIWRQYHNTQWQRIMRGRQAQLNSQPLRTKESALVMWGNGINEEEQPGRRIWKIWCACNDVPVHIEKCDSDNKW